jgi:hypothetical protein
MRWNALRIFSPVPRAAQVRATACCGTGSPDGAVRRIVLECARVVLSWAQFGHTFRREHERPPAVAPSAGPRPCNVISHTQTPATRGAAKNRRATVMKLLRP